MRRVLVAAKGIGYDWPMKNLPAGGACPGVGGQEPIGCGKELRMAIQNWSESIVIAELNDDPQFNEDLNALAEMVEAQPRNAVLNFSAVSFINSSDVSKLLRLRKMLMSHQRRLILCGVNTQVWGIFLVTGLDKIFEFTNDMATALATIQLGAKAPGR